MVVGWADVTMALTKHSPVVVAAPHQPRPPSGVTLWQRHSQMVLTWSPLPFQSILFGFSYSLALFHSPFPGASLRS